MTIDDDLSMIKSVRKLLCSKSLAPEKRDTLEQVFVNLNDKIMNIPAGEQFRQWYDGYVLYRIGIQGDYNGKTRALPPATKD